MSKKLRSLSGILFLIWTAYQAVVTVTNAPGDVADIPRNLSVWRSWLGTIDKWVSLLKLDLRVLVPLVIGLLLLVWPLLEKTFTKTKGRYVLSPPIRKRHTPLVEAFLSGLQRDGEEAMTLGRPGKTVRCEEIPTA